jgi:ring-1,2-phenylacetyl-CoA epoxidase subunit PaaD
MVIDQPVTVEAVWAVLETVMDPEIPVISIVDLGLIREVRLDGDRVCVSMTPTFLGCPAIEVMQTEIASRVRALGAVDVEVEMQLYPPWTSDQITDRGRELLKKFGIAPPARHSGLIQIIFSEAADCPHCGSNNTEQKNPFGATLCRALHYCHNCQQPFEQFKAL